MNTKKIISVVVIAALALTSIQSLYAQNRTISKNYNVANFSEIDTDIVGNVIFTQSNRTSVTAEGDEDMINNLIVKVDGNELKLSMKKSLKRTFKNRKAKLTVKISSSTLHKLESDGVGNITLEGAIKTNNLYIDSDGVGNVTASQLECDQLTVESDGVGNIRLKGKGQFAEYKSDGVGNIDTRDFIAENVIVRSSGVGNIKCYASKNLELYSNGVGSIVYYGEPNIKALNKSGVGSVKQGK